MNVQRITKLALIITMAVTVSAQALTIKLGSLAPVGTPWDTHLKRITAEWTKLSAGKVKLKIYPGGITGDEADMLRKMRLGQLHAAGITTTSLWDIAPGLMAINLPLLVRNNEELAYVLNKMQASFEKDLEAKGYKVLIWSTIGWTHFFSRQPIVIPDDMRKQKLFVWQGDPDEIQAWKEIGFNPVPLAATDIMTSLQNGMIDALATTPLMAASNQYFGVANRMCGMKWSPLLGTIIVSMKTWNKIPKDLQPQLLAAAERIGADMQKDIFATEVQAMDIMKKNGLTVTTITPEQEQKWQEMATTGFSAFLGKGHDKSYYETAKKHLHDFRAQQQK